MESVSSFYTHCKNLAGPCLFILWACSLFSFFVSELFLFPSSRVQIIPPKFRFCLSVCSPPISVSVSIRHGLWKSLQPKPVCSLRCHFLSSPRPRSEGLCCVIIDSRRSWQTLGCLYAASSAPRHTARPTRVHTLQKHNSLSVLQHDKFTVLVCLFVVFLLSYHFFSLYIILLFIFRSFFLSSSTLSSFFLPLIFSPLPLYRFFLIPLFPFSHCPSISLSFLLYGIPKNTRSKHSAEVSSKC